MKENQFLFLILLCGAIYFLYLNTIRWKNKDAIKQYYILKAKYGPPGIYDFSPGGIAIWHYDQISYTCFARIELHDESIGHKSTKLHHDFLYHFINYEVLPHRMMRVQALSGSIAYDPLKKLLRARCASEEANIATLYLAALIGSGKLSIKDIQKNQLYKKTIESTAQPQAVQIMYRRLCKLLKNQPGNPNWTGFFPAAFPKGCGGSMEGFREGENTKEKKNEDLEPTEEEVEAPERNPARNPLEGFRYGKRRRKRIKPWAGGVADPEETEEADEGLVGWAQPRYPNRVMVKSGKITRSPFPYYNKMWLDKKKGKGGKSSKRPTNSYERRRIAKESAQREAFDGTIKNPPGTSYAAHKWPVRWNSTKFPRFMKGTVPRADGRNPGTNPKKTDKQDDKEKRNWAGDAGLKAKMREDPKGRQAAGDDIDGADIEAFVESGPFNLSSRFSGAQESLAQHQNITNRFTGEGFSVGCRPKICTRDAKRCPDGSFVGRDPYNNCKWYDCSKKSEGFSEGADSVSKKFSGEGFSKEGMRLDVHSPSKVEGYQSAEILHKINRMGGSGAKFRFHGDTNLGFHRDVMGVITEDPTWKVDTSILGKNKY